MRKSHHLIAGLSLVAICQAQASAQDTQAEPAQYGVRDIVVTAQKQSENLQDVPISVSAVTGEILQEQQVTNIADLSNTLPNVQINTFSNAPDSAVFTIRGIGVNDADPYVGTTVSVVVDGVVVGVNTAALLSLFDIDRVEVLRGPQGTLFGANTTGGVINVVTKQPTGEFGVEGEIVYGNYNQLEANASVNFPITENLAGKVSVLHNSMDGYFRNYADNRRIGERNITSLRGYLKYDSGNYDATLIGEYVRSRNGSQTGVLIAGPGELFYTPNETEDPFDFKRGLSYDQPDANDRDTYSITLTQNLETGLGDFTSITNYREYNNDLFSDDDATTRVLLQTNRRTKHHQFSQELRDLVTLSDYTRFIVGLFYFEQSYFLDQDGKLDGFLPGLGQPQSQDQDNRSFSVFFQGYQDLTPELTLQAGIRYSYEKTTATSTTANTINPDGQATFDDPLIPGSLITASGEESWNNVGYKIGLDWQPTEQFMIYGYYARGFKSGGFTGRIAIAQDIGPFDPEKLDTFEVGIKSDLFDRLLRLNVSAFLNKYKDMQVVQNITYPSGANSASIANAGKAETKGFEVEATAAPTQGLTLTGSVAYLDAKYDEYDTLILDPATGGLVPVSYAGNSLMNSPKWSASFGFNWQAPVGGGTLTTTGQYSYTSAKFTSYTNLPIERVGAVELVNASMSWGPDDDSWEIGAYVRNLFDEEYFNQKLSLAGIGTLASVGAPRQYGAVFRFRF
ncbi:TonB-dependent receptor [Novosphingobium marinum]|uniref:Iron complex outermembrane receptor protein n=1 Tax=Novosphingobium marinum TaxID=1514948 RepID=A0A7Y9XSF5_9SPHN|nr:TonB-dependent receptor [Novosphingobium marinum]NYH93716.1 iron complex outermembrane receptor protein [Novosphingobium marinum]GGC16773.1 TonB-dependent receptor [Novosphingobium marinum]